MNKNFGIQESVMEDIRSGGFQSYFQTDESLDIMAMTIEGASSMEERKDENTMSTMAMISPKSKAIKKKKE